jgi:hypothetical protein
LRLVAVLQRHLGRARNTRILETRPKAKRLRLTLLGLLAFLRLRALRGIGTDLERLSAKRAGGSEQCPYKGGLKWCNHNFHFGFRRNPRLNRRTRVVYLDSKSARCVGFGLGSPGELIAQPPDSTGKQPLPALYESKNLRVRIIFLDNSGGFSGLIWLAGVRRDANSEKSKPWGISGLSLFQRGLL